MFDWVLNELNTVENCSKKLLIKENESLVSQPDSQLNFYQFSVLYTQKIPNT